MSDGLGMCLQIIDNGVSIGTSAWGVCVYSISRGQMVLTGSILLYCLTVFNIATVNLSDFSHSALISAIICLETISLFRLIGCLRGHVVRVFAAVIVLVLLIGISGFGLGGLPCFLLTGIVSNVFVLCA